MLYCPILVLNKVYYYYYYVYNIKVMINQFLPRTHSCLEQWVFIVDLNLRIETYVCVQ